MADCLICHFLIMHVHSLKVDSFRNIKEAKLEPVAGCNIFYGNNASGKTNLLEAIFVLCLGRSQRGAKDNVLIRSDEDVFRVEGVIEGRGSKHEVAVACSRGGRKKVTIDKVVAKTSELYDCFSAVSAGPEDSELLSGSPSGRRLFLDIYVSQMSRRYLDLLTDYRKVLAQKNASLKEGYDTDPFDELLINYGSKILHRRKLFLDDLSRRSGEYYAEISGGGKLEAIYQPTVPINENGDLDSIIESFRTTMEKNRRREQALQTSVIGPHRDDIEFFINDYPARSHGSQGEWRTAAVALKLTVYHILKELHNDPPLLLLDEIFAELDNDRTEQLIKAFGSLGQIFLTTALEPPELLKKNGLSFRIKAGQIEEVH